MERSRSRPKAILDGLARLIGDFINAIGHNRKWPPFPSIISTEGLANLIGACATHAPFRRRSLIRKYFPSFN